MRRISFRHMSRMIGAALRTDYTPGTEQAKAYLQPLCLAPPAFHHDLFRHVVTRHNLVPVTSRIINNDNAISAETEVEIQHRLKPEMDRLIEELLAANESKRYTSRQVWNYLLGMPLYPDRIVVLSYLLRSALIPYVQLPTQIFTALIPDDVYHYLHASAHWPMIRRIRDDRNLTGEQRAIALTLLLDQEENGAVRAAIINLCATDDNYSPTDVGETNNQDEEDSDIPWDEASDDSTDEQLEL